MLTAHTVKIIQSLDKKKFRQKYNLFLVEGEHLVNEAFKHGYLKEVVSLEITNYNVKQTLDAHPKFQKEREISKKVKYNNRVHETKRKSPITLLKEFKKEYCENNENMIIDIDVIINKLKKK